jgi:LacI family transcriptional regulator
MDYPLVLVDHEERLLEVDAVVNDNVDAAQEVCNRLISSDCASITFIGDDQFSVSFKNRFIGCELAVKDRQPDVNGYQRSLIKQAGPSTYPTEHVQLSKITIPYFCKWKEHLQHYVRKATSTQQIPDAYICANDHIAIELMNQLAQTGLRIPQDCKVIGFDNIDIASYTNPPLTTVDLSKEMLGKRAVEVLHRRIRQPGAPHEKVMLSSRLIPRESG